MKENIKAHLTIYGQSIQQPVVREGCQTSLKDLPDGRLQLEVNDGQGLQISLIFEKDATTN